MQEASFTGLLRTIAIFLVIYYALKIIARYVFPLFVKRTMNKMEDKFRAQQEAQQPHHKAGETVIDKKPQSHKKEADSGEYIDYEEID